MAVMFVDSNATLTNVSWIYVVGTHVCNLPKTICMNPVGSVESNHIRIPTTCLTYQLSAHWSDIIQIAGKVNPRKIL